MDREKRQPLTSVCATGAGAVAALAICVSLAGCASQAQQKSPAQPPAPVVEVVQVAPTSATIYAEYPAQTYARNQVEVRGRVEGYIEKWLFRPGQQVQAGQPLYILDTRPYRAQVQQAEGNVRQSEADLTFAQQQVSLLQAEANLATAQSNLTKARQDYERFKPLVEQDAAAKQDLDAAVAALRAAESNLSAQQANVQQTRLSTQTQIQSAQGKLQTQRGALQNATLNLQYATIKAPISGLIGDTNVSVGGLVTPTSSSPLTTIVPLDPIWVRFKVTESQYLNTVQNRGGIRASDLPLELYLANNVKFPAAGHITNTLNQVDPRTGTLELQANFPNPQHTLLPGQFGRVRFPAEKRDNVLMVPQRAVQQNQSLQSLFVLSADNKVEVRSVKTGERVGESWIIEQGLRPGDRVIVEGLLTVRPGLTVNPKPFVERPSGQSPGKVG